MGNPSYRTRSLPLGLFFVGRVDEDSAVENGAVHIGDHRSNITRGVASIFEILDGCFDRLIPVVVIPFVARVDLLSTISGELNIAVGVDELSK